MSNFRLLSQAGTSIVLADPSDIGHTFKVNIDMAQKMAGKVKLTNVRQTFNQAKQVTVTDSTESGKDQLSVRLVLSGSSASAAEVNSMLDAFIANVKSAIAADTSHGFVPVNVQFITTPVV